MRKKMRRTARGGVLGLLMLTALLSAMAVPHAAAQGNRFVWAQLAHDGAWDPYPAAHERVIAMVRQMTNITVADGRAVRSLEDGTVFESPFLVIKGDAALRLSPTAKTRLKQFIDRGGLIFCDDTLGESRGPFSRSVRRLFQELYPDRAFARLPMDHPIFRSFFLLRTVAGRRVADRFLEGLDVGNPLGGEERTAVILSSNDILGAWVRGPVGQYAFRCEPGGEPQRWEAFKLTVNIVYFAVTGTYKRDAVHQPFIEEKLRY